jgi:hypothetical protein
VSFHVRHPTDQVNLYLAFNRLFHRSISAFPTSMKWIENKQKLKAKFGQPDHRSRLEPQARETCCGEVGHHTGPSATVPNRKKRSLAIRISSRKKRRT